MTSKTLVSKSTPEADFVTVVSEELRLESVYFENVLELVSDKFEAAPELTEVDRPLPDVAFLGGVPLADGPEGVTFNGTQELSYNVRNYFLPGTRYRRTFDQMAAFGMWADRKESDEELLRQLGSQWDGGGDAC